jgi:hypothetical protein
MPGAPIAVTIGINIASAAAYDFLKSSVQRKVKKHRSFYPRLADHLGAQTGWTVDPRKLEATLFLPEVWMGVMVQADTRQWAHLLSSLMPPWASDRDGIEFGDALRDGVLRFAEADIRAAVTEAQIGGWLGGQLSLMSHDVDALLDGQAEIYTELLNSQRMIAEVHALVEASRSDEDPPESFSPSITAYMAQFDRRVTELTDEQCRVIKGLTGRSRVLVTGIAGSGKTLVAAQKAIRLSNAGIRTLFLCHNPFLADKVSVMTAGSGVAVQSFTRWIVDAEGLEAPLTGWSNMEEPHSDELFEALSRILESSERFDAVVVDEGQDFREDWWMLAQAALKSPEHGVLYIFADDTQAILPYRATYPDVEVRLSLTRNCRNSGAIFKAMGWLCPGLPEGDPLLADFGRVRLSTYQSAQPVPAIERALDWLGTGREAIGDQSTVLLVNEPTMARLDGSVLLLKSDRGNASWREPLIASLTMIGNQRGNSFDIESRGWVDQIDVRYDRLEGWLERLRSDLSTGNLPRPSDVRLCREAARDLFVIRSGAPLLEWGQDVELVDIGGKAYFAFPHGSVWNGGYQSRWDGLTYESAASVPLCAALQIGTWADGYRPEGAIDIAPSAKVGADTLAMFTAAEFKGLEVDSAIVLWDNTGIAPLSELLVSISRARLHLVLLVAAGAELALPPTVLARFT